MLVAVMHTPNLQNCNDASAQGTSRFEVFRSAMLKRPEATLQFIFLV